MNPAASSRAGSTRALVSSSADSSPSPARSSGAGTRSQRKSGRRSAACRAAVSSSPVTGLGAVRLNGPACASASGESSRKRIARISSVSEIQLITW